MTEEKERGGRRGGKGSETVECSDSAYHTFVGVRVPRWPYEERYGPFFDFVILEMGVQFLKGRRKM